MVLALFYLIERFFYRLLDFFRHWYVKSFFIYYHQVITFFEKLDRTFALKITLRHLFQPLYKDYTLIGYFLGFIFRAFRIVAVSLIYLFLIILAALLYLLWILLPLYALIKIINF